MTTTRHAGDAIATWLSVRDGPDATSATDTTKVSAASSAVSSSTATVACLAARQRISPPPTSTRTKSDRAKPSNASETTT